jgi:hypothetical protein
MIQVLRNEILKLNHLLLVQTKKEMQELKMIEDHMLL